MIVYDFPTLGIGNFFGINTNLRINPNSIPDTDMLFCLLWLGYYRHVVGMNKDSPYWGKALRAEAP